MRSAVASAIGRGARAVGRRLTTFGSAVRQRFSRNAAPAAGASSGDS